MPHTFYYNPETHIIELKAHGTMTLDEFKEIVSEGMQLAKEKHCILFLNDFREATKIELTTMKIFGMAQIITNVAALLGLPTHKLKRANVITPKHAVDARFAEDTLVNRGQTTRFFLDIEEAKKWLQDE